MFLKDVTFANLTSILDFMYHGEVNVSHNELATFLKTAEALKVRGLAEDEKKRVSFDFYIFVFNFIIYFLYWLKISWLLTCIGTGCGFGIYNGQAFNNQL